MMGMAACCVAVALELEVASAAAPAFRSRSLDMACFSKADKRLIAPSKVPKKPPFGLDEEEGLFNEEVGVGTLPVAISPISLPFEGVTGATGVLTAAKAAEAAAAAILALASAKRMREHRAENQKR